MVDRFNSLSDRDNVELEVWFSAREKPDRSWRVDEDSWHFPHRYLPRVGRGEYFVALPTPLLRGPAPDVFVTLHSRIDFLLGFALARRKGARTAFWVLTTYDAWVRRRRWKERAKSIIFQRVDAVLTPGGDGRAFARRYGTTEDRIHTVPQVIDVDHFRRRSNLSTTERDLFRTELGLTGVTFLYVGRLWRGKGLTFLLDAFRALEKTNIETTLLLVGDGADEQDLRKRCREIGARNVIFAGFHHRDSLPRLYAASDVFVFPTLGDPFGLVVLEAMACGLPVIATTAAGEIHDRVTDGSNGFIVSAGDSAELLDRMTILARDPELRARMGRVSAQRALGQTPDFWAQQFEEAIESLLAIPPASEPSTFQSRRSGVSAE